MQSRNEKKTPKGKLSKTLHLNKSKRKCNTILNDKDIEWGEEIGSGGFATVYKGQWKNKQVAIKVLKPGEDESCFHDEKDIMQSLRGLEKSNSHIIKLYAVIENAKTCGLVMEYMPDGNLVDYIEKNRDILLLDRLALDIALGLMYLHSYNFIHRDIKPDNVMIKSNRAKIGDFGLSAKKENLKAELVGTPHYLAPELIADNNYSDKSDMYAFALVLFEMYTGDFPYPLNCSPFQIMLRVNQYQARPIIQKNKALPFHIDNLMKESWAQDPEKRPSARQTVKKLKKIIKTHENLVENKNILTVYAGLHANSLFSVFPKNVINQIAKNMDDLNRYEKHLRLNQK